MLGPIVASQRSHDLSVRGMTARVTMGGQPLGVTFPFEEAADDRESGRPGEIAEHGVELEVHLGQRLLHALNASRRFLDQGRALAYKGAQRHDGGGGTEAG